MTSSSRVEVDLGKVERNLGVIRGVVAPESGPGGASGGARHGVSVCAVLKQDGYGLGAARLAKKLVGGAGAGVEMIAVYSLAEARAILEAVANVPVLVLMPVTGVDRADPLYRQVASGRVHLTLHSEDQLKQLGEMSARMGTPLPLHLQVDTGLSRGGAMSDEGRRLVEKLLSPAAGRGGGGRLAGLMTHFASPCCDCEFTREQARLFRDFVESIKPALKAAVAGAGKGGRVAPQELALHASNSCAMFRARSYHGTMVRVGQALMGFALEDVAEDERGGFEFSAQAARLEPAARWTTTAVHLSEIPAGWPVGYGSTWRAPWREDGRKTRIALIPVGYADGYPRTLGGRPGGGAGWVGFTGRAWDKRNITDQVERGPRPAPVYAPVVGRVSMDQITVDVTDVPEQYLGGAGRIGSVECGPEVELMSGERGAPNFWTTMAAAAGSITHEQLCRIGARVERVYRAGAAVSAGVAGGNAGGEPRAIVKLADSVATPAAARMPQASEDGGEATGMAAYAG